MQIVARSRSCLRLNFVVPLVAVACLGSRARASARMRDPLLVGRRWFGCVSSFVRVNGCRSLALVPSGWRRGLVGVLPRCFGVAPGAFRGVIARARVLALLVRACFLVWSVVGSVLMLCAHANTHRPPLLVFPMGAVRRRSCRGVA